MPEMEISVVFYLSTLRYINIYLLDELSHFFFSTMERKYIKVRGILSRA